MGLPAKNMEEQDIKKYRALDTGLRFHNSTARIRAVVGPVGSGKTAMAAQEGCYYIPWFLYKKFGIKHTRGVVVRNVYRELIDTTQATYLDWFPWGSYYGKREMYTLGYPGGPSMEILFRACDSIKHVRQFKSLEITWYHIDESIEVAPEVKLMLRNRIGRYPRLKCLKCGEHMEVLEMPERDENGDIQYYYQCPKCDYTLDPSTPLKFGMETTNPPDVEHPTYSEFDWAEGGNLPPGPIPDKPPKKGYAGFWQPPFENIKNLPINYYRDLLDDYRDQSDWADMYVRGKPGIIIKGKLIYHNFKRDYHVAKESLVWSGQPLFRGWDDSGNSPACIVIMCPSPGRVHILKEFCADKMNTGQFGEYVINQCNILFPNAEYTDYDDPAGWNKFSKKEGGFTSNAQLVQEATGITLHASEQNLTARLNAVDDQLAKIDGILIDPGCIRLINGFMGGYCYPELGLTGEYKDEPVKNRFSHIQEALQYVLVKLVKATKMASKHKPRPKRIRRRNAMAV